MAEAKIDDYIRQFDTHVGFGAEGTVLEKRNSGLVLKKIGKDDSIFLPENFELKNFWDNPDKELDELLISSKLAGIPSASDYFLFPLAYSVDKQKKEIFLLMPKAEGTLSDQSEALQQDPSRHIKHLLSGFSLLLENGILQHDNTATNILYDPNKKTFKFADFGRSYLLDNLVQDENQSEAIKLLIEAYEYLLISITFCLAGGSNMLTNENPDYLNFKNIIDLLVEERTDWKNQNLSSVTDAYDALTRRISHFYSILG